MNFVKPVIYTALLLLSTCGLAISSKQGPILFKGLTVHGDTIVFSAAGNLWQVSRTGGVATPLTQGSEDKSQPLFSPSGDKVAYMQVSGGNAEVYWLDLASGTANRLTNHPAKDWPVAWQPDGKAIYFASHRHRRFASDLFKLELGGVLAQKLPLNVASELSFNGGGQAALVPTSHNPKQLPQRYYRGGQKSVIHLIDNPLSGQWQATSQVFDEFANNFSPRWQNNNLYYLSDKLGVANIYRHGKFAKALTHYTRYGVADFALDQQGLVFIQDGAIHTADLNGQQQQALTIDIPTTDKLKKVRRINAYSDISELSLSDDGQQVIAVARGDVFMASTNSHTAANLTKSANAAQRQATLSPDGRFMAYFSDATGKNRLYIQTVDQSLATKGYDIEADPGFYLDLAWSPDGQKLSFNDHRLQLWLFDSRAEVFTKLAQSTFSGQNQFHRAWSPDSRFLAYAQQDQYGMSAIYVYDNQTERSTQITKTDENATLPAFDKNGRYLYYVASNNLNATNYRWAVLNGIFERARSKAKIKAITLKDGDEPAVLAGLKMPNLAVTWSDAPVDVSIDLAGIEQRTVALDIDDYDVVSLNAFSSGKLHLVTQSWRSPLRINDEPEYQLMSLNLNNPTQLKPRIKGFSTITFAAGGTKALYKLGDNRYLLDLTQSKALPAPLKLKRLFKALEPEQEWRQMFNESFNFMVEQLYDPNLHGADKQRLYQEYARYLPNLTRRQDLTELLRQMIGFLSVSHSGSSQGDNGPGQANRENIGLLGADFSVTKGRYRVDQVYRTVNTYNAPFAPLDQYGAKVKDGDYLIALNHQNITTDKPLYRYFFGLADTAVQLKIADNVQGQNARTIQVKLLRSETALRLANWAAANQQYVAKQTGSAVKYVHIPRFNQQGIEHFMAQFYRITDAKGLVIDLRFNPGGITADALIDLLQRKTLYRYRFRQGADLSTPVNAFNGQLTLLINPYDASAAETFAQMFKAAKLGTVVGQPTYGAGIGPYAFGLTLVDGATVAIPNRGSYLPNGQWNIENRGVQPDIRVEPALQATAPDGDTQLNQAIAINIKALKEAKPQPWQSPIYPIHPGTQRGL